MVCQNLWCFDCSESAPPKRLLIEDHLHLHVCSLLCQAQQLSEVPPNEMNVNCGPDLICPAMFLLEISPCTMVSGDMMSNCFVNFAGKACAVDRDGNAGAREMVDGC